MVSEKCSNCLGHIPAGVQYRILGPYEGSRHSQVYNRYCPACWPTGTAESKARQWAFILRQWDDDPAIDMEREAK